MNYSEAVFPVMAVNLRHGYSKLLRDWNAVLDFVKNHHGVEKKRRSFIPASYVWRMTKEQKEDYGFDNWIWRLVDDWGRILYREDVSDYRLSCEEVRGYSRYGREIRYDFRNGPVPYTGCRKTYGSYYRHPATHGEERINQAWTSGGFADDDMDETDAAMVDAMVARSGRIRPLRNSYDDIVYSRQHSWKSHRKTQWKPSR